MFLTFGHFPGVKTMHTHGEGTAETTQEPCRSEAITGQWARVGVSY